jgi:hypothetical protein
LRFLPLSGSPIFAKNLAQMTSSGTLWQFGE